MLTIYPSSLSKQDNARPETQTSRRAIHVVRRTPFKGRPTPSKDWDITVCSAGVISQGGESLFTKLPDPSEGETGSPDPSTVLTFTPWHSSPSGVGLHLTYHASSASVIFDVGPASSLEPCRARWSFQPPSSGTPSVLPLSVAKRVNTFYIAERFKGARCLRASPAPLSLRPHPQCTKKPMRFIPTCIASAAFKQDEGVRGPIKSRTCLPAACQAGCSSPTCSLKG